MSEQYQQILRGLIANVNTVQEQISQEDRIKRLLGSLTHNFTNASVGVSHSIIFLPFIYPARLTPSPELFGITHHFEAKDDNGIVFYTLTYKIHPSIFTDSPPFIVTKNPHRNHCPHIIVTWWDIPSDFPIQLEDQLTCDSANGSFGLIPLISVLDHFFYKNGAPALSPPFTRQSFPPRLNLNPGIAFTPEHPATVRQNQPPPVSSPSTLTYASSSN